MELFAISCTTCQARLKVRDMAAIGKILACPKCQSMVQVLPPPGWQPPASGTSPSAGASSSAPAAAPTASAAAESIPTGLTIKVSAAAVAELRAAAQASNTPTTPAPQPPSANLPPAAAPAGARAGATAPRTMKPVAQAAPPQMLPEPVSIPYEQINPNDIPPLPMPQPGEGLAARLLTSLGQRRTLMIAAPVAAILVALLAWILFRTGGEPIKVAATPGATVGTSENGPLLVDDALLPADAEDAPTDLPSAAEAPDAGATATAASEPPTAEEPNAATARTDADPAADTPPSDDLPNRDAGNRHDAITALPTEPEAEPAASTPDPAANKRDLATVTAPANAKLPIDEPPAVAAPADAEAPMDEDGNDDDMLTGLETRPIIDLTARLADPLPSVQFKRMPLADFCDVLARLSTIPISLDTDALAAAGVRVTDVISISAQDTTVGDLLAQVLAKRGLTFSTTDQQVIVTTADAQAEKLTTFHHDVHDLVKDQAETAQLATLVTRFVAPASWDQQGGQGRLTSDNGELVVEQLPLVQRRVAMFLNKLRVARGLPAGTPAAATGNKPDAALQTRYGRAKANLDNDITANFSAATPLADILAWLERQTKTRILIDEASLADAGLWSRSPASVVADHQPLREALTALLTPLGMTYRIVDDKTIQVFARRDLADRLEVEMFPVENLLAKRVEPKDLVARLRERLGPLASEAGGLTTIEVDEAGKYLLAVASPEALIRLETTLVRSGAGAKAAK